MIRVDVPRVARRPWSGLGGLIGRVGWDPAIQSTPDEGGDLVDDYSGSLVEVASS